VSDPPAADTRGRLLDALSGAPYDLVALSEPENVAYATGYRSVAGDIFSSHRMAALVGRGVLAVVAPAADAGALTEFVGDHEPFGTFFFEGDHPVTGFAGRNASFCEALAAAVKRLGLSGRIGVDDRVGEDGRAVLEAAGLDVVSAGHWLQSVRSVKLPGEIERLAASARIAEQGIDAAIASARSGATERELASVVASTMTAAGGMPRFVVVTSAERSALSDARATSRRLRPGDLVRFDVGCTVDGYWSDVGRTAVVGEPDALQASRYAAILAGEEAQIAALVPGVSAGDLFDVAVAAVEAAGLMPYRRHHCGHGIGSSVYEPPIVSPGTVDVIEPGMVLCLETPFYELGWGGMMVEDTILVTGEGRRMLTHSDRSLRVIAP
jgi:Xaa-Pro aminopeptidase